MNMWPGLWVIMNAGLDASATACLNRKPRPFEVRDAACEPLKRCVQPFFFDELREVFFRHSDIINVEEIARIELTVI